MGLIDPRSLISGSLRFFTLIRGSYHSVFLVVVCVCIQFKSTAQVFTIHDMINARNCEAVECLDSLAFDNGFSIAGVDTMRYQYTSYYISDLRLKTSTDPTIVANNFASFHRTRALILNAKFSTCNEKQFQDIESELEDFQFEKISSTVGEDGHSVSHHQSALVPYVTDCTLRTYTYNSGGLSWTYYECDLAFSKL